MVVAPFNMSDEVGRDDVEVEAELGDGGGMSASAEILISRFKAGSGWY